jgi:hypothetical protein
MVDDYQKFLLRTSISQMSTSRRLVRAKTPDCVLFLPIFLSTDLSLHASHKDDTLKKHVGHIEREDAGLKGFAHI